MGLENNGCGVQEQILVLYGNCFKQRAAQDRGNFDPREHFVFFTLQFVVNYDWTKHCVCSSVSLFFLNSVSAVVSQQTNFVFYAHVL